MRSVANRGMIPSPSEYHLTAKCAMARLGHPQAPCQMVFTGEDGLQIVIDLDKAKVRLLAILLHEIRERME